MSEERRDVLDSLLETEDLPCGCMEEGEPWGCDCGNVGDAQAEAAAQARNALREELRPAVDAKTAHLRTLARELYGALEEVLDDYEAQSNPSPSLGDEVGDVMRRAREAGIEPTRDEGGGG